MLSFLFVDDVCMPLLPLYQEGTVTKCARPFVFGGTSNDQLRRLVSSFQKFLSSAMGKIRTFRCCRPWFFAFLLVDKVDASLKDSTTNNNKQQQRLNVCLCDVSDEVADLYLCQFVIGRFDVWVRRYDEVFLFRSQPMRWIHFLSFLVIRAQKFCWSNHKMGTLSKKQNKKIHHLQVSQHSSRNPMTYPSVYIRKRMCTSNLLLYASNLLLYNMTHRRLSRWNIYTDLGGGSFSSYNILILLVLPVVLTEYSIFLFCFFHVWWVVISLFSFYTCVFSLKGKYRKKLVMCIKKPVMVRYHRKIGARNHHEMMLTLLLYTV